MRKKEKIGKEVDAYRLYENKIKKVEMLSPYYGSKSATQNGPKTLLKPSSKQSQIMAQL